MFDKPTPIYKQLGCRFILFLIQITAGGNPHVPFENTRKIQLIGKTSGIGDLSYGKIPRLEKRSRFVDAVAH